MIFSIFRFFCTLLRYCPIINHTSMESYLSGSCINLNVTELTLLTGFVLQGHSPSPHKLKASRYLASDAEVCVVQVCEERQKHTELEMEEFRQTCAAKMQKASHKAQREQQLLQLQMFQQQQEKQQQQEDMTQILQERQRLEDRCASFEREHTQLGPRLEETRWEVRSVCIAQYSENTPNGNASISQKLPYIEKKKYARGSKRIRKMNNSQKCNANVFFWHLQLMWRHIIILQCTITSKKHFIRGHARI